MGNKRTALVTGGNRGIGFEACRQLGRHGMRVVLTSRDNAAGERAAEQLRSEGLDILCLQLDVSLSASVEACATTLQDQKVLIDVLVNNAGVYITTPVLQVREADFKQSLEVNALGAWRMCQAFLPAMLARGYGRVVNVSSGSGQLSQLRGPSDGVYGISKTALDAITRQLAEAAHGDVKVNAMCPGWVATRMGGTSAPRTPEEAVRALVWLATLPADGPNGGFFRDKKPIAW